ncbi:MAG: hypothetical protein U0795_01480 [Pirellulales bacterium]
MGRQVDMVPRIDVNFSNGTLRQPVKIVGQEPVPPAIGKNGHSFVNIRLAAPKRPTKAEIPLNDDLGVFPLLGRIVLGFGH